MTGTKRITVKTKDSLSNRFTKAISTLPKTERVRLAKIYNAASDPIKRYQLLRKEIAGSNPLIGTAKLNSALTSIYEGLQGYGDAMQKASAVIGIVGLKKAGLVKTANLNGVVDSIRNCWKQRQNLIGKVKNFKGSKVERHKLMLIDGAILANMQRETPNLFNHISIGNNYVFDALAVFYKQAFNIK